jgi:hypothetical protein
VGRTRLILERFGKFWGAFSVIDLFILNRLTIVTEFIGINLALGFPGASGVGHSGRRLRSDRGRKHGQPIGAREAPVSVSARADGPSRRRRATSPRRRARAVADTNRREPRLAGWIADQPRL